MTAETTTNFAQPNSKPGLLGIIDEGENTAIDDALQALQSDTEVTGLEHIPAVETVGRHRGPAELAGNGIGPDFEPVAAEPAAPSLMSNLTAKAIGRHRKQRAGKHRAAPESRAARATLFAQDAVVSPLAKQTEKLAGWNASRPPLMDVWDKHIKDFQPRESRIEKLSRRVGAWASGALPGFRDYLADKERDGKRSNRRKITAAALAGGVALTGLAYLTAHSIDSGGRSASLATTTAGDNAERPHDSTSDVVQSIHQNFHPAMPNTPDTLDLKINSGDRPWNVLHDAGIVNPIAALRKAAKASGLPYQWHGRDSMHKWIDVDGHSDTKTVISLLADDLK